MSVFQTSRRVEFRDTDGAGIMHFSTYLTKMEEVEHEFLRSLGLSVVMHNPDGSMHSWPRVSVHCDYRGAARFEQVLAIDVGIAKLGRTSVVYAFTFRLDDVTLATGQITAVYCRFNGADRPQPVAIPEEIRQRFEPYLLPS